MKYWQLILLALCLLPYEAGATPKHRMVSPRPQTIAYFISFPMETYVPVTPETIKKAGDKATLTPDDVFVLGRILQDRGNTIRFETVKTRLRIDSPNAVPVFVDQNGNVLQGNQHYSLRPAALVSLAELMRRCFQRKHIGSGK